MFGNFQKVTLLRNASPRKFSNSDEAEGCLHADLLAQFEPWVNLWGHCFASHELSWVSGENWAPWSYCGAMKLDFASNDNVVVHVGISPSDDANCHEIRALRSQPVQRKLVFQALH